MRWQLHLAESYRAPRLSLLNSVAERGLVGLLRVMLKFHLAQYSLLGSQWCPQSSGGSPVLPVPKSGLGEEVL